MSHTTINWVGLDREPKRLELEPARSYAIGRRQGISILVSDPLVSGAHAELRCVDGTWSVEDTGSRNGTYVRQARGGREQRLAARRSLRDGDAIRVGATLLSFRDPQPHSDVVGTALDDRLPVAAPSPAEQRVLDALCADLLAGRQQIPSQRELAERMFLSEETIPKHLKSLYDKFGIVGPGTGKMWRLALQAVDDGWAS